jgi:orotate phosphoribosyltransferase
MNLFVKQNIKLHSGEQSDFKIECDALTNEDWECLAFLISKKCKFQYVVGVPNGGNVLADKLQEYAVNSNARLPLLIVDDVLTTGNSMEDFKFEMQSMHRYIIGFVIFSRGKLPNWINALFQMQ